MSHFRDYLVSTFGIERNNTVITNEDIRIQHESDDKPFAEIVTDDKGKTVLRVGQTLTHAPVVKIR